MVIGYNVSLYELSVLAHTNPHHDPDSCRPVLAAVSQGQCICGMQEVTKQMKYSACLLRLIMTHYFCRCNSTYLHLAHTFAVLFEFLVSFADDEIVRELGGWASLAE